MDVQLKGRGLPTASCNSSKGSNTATRTHPPTKPRFTACVTMLTHAGRHGRASSLRPIPRSARRERERLDHRNLHRRRPRELDTPARFGEFKRVAARDEAFSDIVEPHLRAGRVIVDSTRHVTKTEYALGSPIMPYLTVRATALAQDFFDADYSVVACLVEHQAFFRRMFGCVPWSQPRIRYPNFNRPMAFLGYDCGSAERRLTPAIPFLAPPKTSGRAPLLAIVHGR